MDRLHEQFTQQINEISQSTSRTNSVSIIKITKNDSIKRKVANITTQLHESKHVLIASLSNSIPKAISIIEIVKSVFKEENVKLQQFNRLTHLESTHNPSYKPKQENSEESDKKQDDEKRQQMIEEEVLQSINGPKVYQLPVMYVILSIDDTLPFDLTSWNKQ
ncbi:hypothetical protein JA1_000208 [Spathaspora sp. JA1]|nr:hypothetical protein JA1_000208 [Spathaspora sp. JA1]